MHNQPGMWTSLSLRSYTSTFPTFLSGEGGNYPPGLSISSLCFSSFPFLSFLCPPLYILSHTVLSPNIHTNIMFFSLTLWRRRHKWEILCKWYWGWRLLWLLNVTLENSISVPACITFPCLHHLLPADQAQPRWGQNLCLMQSAQCVFPCKKLKQDVVSGWIIIES